MACEHLECGQRDCRTEFSILFTITELINSNVNSPMWLAAAMADSTALKHGVQDRVSSSLGSSDEKGHEKEENGEKKTK